jgi:DNA-binding transcriptional regulator YiaG
MSSLAVALKDEIRRLARKEIKAHTASTSRAVALYRKEIAALKRQAREQSKKIAFLESQDRKRVDSPPAANGGLDGSRFSARSVKAQRRKTGLSAADYAKLIGVSGLTIYNWEQAKSRPRKEQLASLIAVRGLGKRQAQLKLEALNGMAIQKPVNGAKRKQKAAAK